MNLPESTVRPPAPASTGQRLWKGFGSTPWWRLLGGGLIVLVAVALFAVPFDTIQLSRTLKSSAAQREIKLALQKQVLEHARTGLISVQSIAVGTDAEALKEVHDAIVDVERDLSAPRHEVTVRGVAGLQRLIDTQREDVKRSARAIEQFAAKLRNNPDGIDTAGGLEQLNSKLEALQQNVEALHEMQDRLKEAHDAATEAQRDATDGTQGAASASDKVFTFNLFGTRAQAVLGGDRPASTPATPPTPPTPSTAPTPPVAGPAPLAPPSPPSPPAVSDLDPDTRNLIQTTVKRDVDKVVFGGISLLVLSTLFLLMLIARSFAGRATRGEQRAAIAESRERSESHARQLAEARLMVMRAQVEPHFLFNTLAHVQALQEIDPPQASTMLERLISYLRAAMPSMRETSSTLGREVEVVRAYLDLLKIRMGDRLSYSIECPADVAALSFPPTMIATLVENAIKHGLEPKREGGSVAIRVQLQGEQIEVLVADSGLGLGGANTQGTGVGLANTRERLRMLYGDTGQLVVEPNVPTGVRAILRVPKSPPAMVAAEPEVTDGISPYMVQTTGILALLFGWLGAHRFYVGHRRTAAFQAVLGILSILSGGVPIFLLPLLLWVVLDLTWIGTREFHDGQGRRIARWSEDDRREYQARGPTHQPRDENASPFSRAIALVLVVPLGFLGAHRFYVGRPGSAFAMILTLGGACIWWLVDIARVASGTLRDGDGKRVSEWE